MSDDHQPTLESRVFLLEQAVGMLISEKENQAKSPGEALYWSGLRSSLISCRDEEQD